jgi:SAM-dependent methyltransferase
VEDREPVRAGEGRPEDFLDRAARRYYYKPLAAFFNAFLIRAYASSGLRPAGPVLDAGCFEGSFGVLLTESLGIRPRMLGIDLNGAALRRPDPRARGLYRSLILASATSLPFADRSFRTVLFNASLFAVEPGPGPAIREARRVLTAGGSVWVSVPTDLFSRRYWLARLLNRAGLPGRARSYTRSMDRRLMHSHVFPASGWRRLLEENGFSVRDCRGFLSPSLTTFWSFLAWTPWRVIGASRLIPGPWPRRVLSRFWAGAFRKRYRSGGRGMDPDSSTYVLIRAQRKAAGSAQRS